MTGVHIEGMGWLGSALARTLEQRGIEFTWNDTETEFSAWPASSGSIMPDGDDTSERNREAWGYWIESGLFPEEYVTKSSLVYMQKNPPHGGHYKGIELDGGLHLADTNSYVANVPFIVQDTRLKYAHLRTNEAPGDAMKIVAHGFSDRFDRCEWGWTSDVTLSLPKFLADLPGLSLYGRANRFEVVYATGRPGMPGRFRLGSSMVAQRRPARNPEAAMRALLKRIEMMPGMYAGTKVVSWETPVEGWRPSAVGGASVDVEVRNPKLIVMPPMLHSGIRWSPEVVERTADLAEMLS